jgi:cardiolipin synthase C
MRGMHLRCGLVVALLLAASLQGCTLTRAQIKRADTVVATSVDRQSTCSRDDHCAIQSPLLDAADQAFAHSTLDRPEHVVTLLDDSEAAMVARINLIRAARQSIDVQTYIWD